MLFKKVLLAAFVSLAVCSLQAQRTTLSSPDKNLQLAFWLNDKGTAMYELSYKGKAVILPSSLGFDLKKTYDDSPLPTLKEGLTVTSATQTSNDTKWKPVWGDVKEIRDNYSQLSVSLSQKGDKAIQFNVIFKLFNDGLGFRFEFPEQKNIQHFIISGVWVAFLSKNVCA